MKNAQSHPKAELSVLVSAESTATYTDYQGVVMAVLLITPMRRQKNDSIVSVRNSYDLVRQLWANGLVVISEFAPLIDRYRRPVSWFA